VLTADLLQVNIRGGEVRPRYIDGENQELLAIAESLIRIYNESIGRSRQDLDTDLEDYLGTGTDFIFHRGLAKLLLDRCEFDTESESEPIALRRRIWEASAKVHRESIGKSFDRTDVIQRILDEHACDAEAIEKQMYADLKDQQVLREFRSCAPAWLLQRYNVSLAQSVLLRATSMEVALGKQPVSKYREVFRKIKFFQLMHQVEGTAATGYTIRLDGPLSLFKSSQKYGMQMANFLPTLLHCEKWKLSANLLWGKKKVERRFRLSPRQNLRPHTRLTGQWQPAEMTWLLEQFPKLDSDWTISNDAEIIDLGGRGIMIPDYVFEHIDGRRVFMEAFGFWRRSAAQSRLDTLREHGPDNFILALSKDLFTGEEDYSDLPGEVYVFRSAPIAREVLKVLEEMSDT
jgi:hypothetical protein